MSESRKAFEAFVLAAVGGPTPTVFTAHYVALVQAVASTAWQASRYQTLDEAAKVIDALDVGGDPYDDDGGYCGSKPEQCAAAIRALKEQA